MTKRFKIERFLSVAGRAAKERRQHTPVESLAKVAKTFGPAKIQIGKAETVGEFRYGNILPARFWHTDCNRWSQTKSLKTQVT
ncbi:MAG: hypothetical protein WBD31_20755 [Rubripirellula sp.]